MPMNFPFSVLEANDFDVVGFGVNAVDYLIRVPEYPAFNSKTELTSYSQAAGGEVATTLTGLQRLGLKTAYAGRFGSDAEGEFGLRSLIEEGVDVSYAETIENARTQVGFIVIDDSSGERTVMWHRDPMLSYGNDALSAEIPTRGRVLHLTPHDTQACITFAKLARASGVIVSMDLDRVFDGIDQLLPLVDVCIASADIPEKLVGASDTAAGMRGINSRFGCAIVGLTRGDAGSMFLCDDSIIETPAFPVPGGCIDTTGAGDAFRSGFLYGMLSGETVDQSIVCANAVAALKCRGTGARSRLPSKDELISFIKKHRH
jgi:sulfofructose kinase